MSVRTAKAEWRGDLRTGAGTVSTESGALDTSYDAPSRFETGDLTNPEELLGAALAACFSMALSNILAGAGHVPTRVTTEAHVLLEKKDAGPTVTRIDLVCDAEVDGLDDDAFQRHAQTAKAGCPMSRAVTGPEITLEATLR